MKNIKLLLFGLFLCCGILGSCSDVKFGDNFLGDAPESTGAVQDTMFNSKNNADKVLTKAYTYLPYGLPTSADSKMGGNILETLTDLYSSFRENIGDGPTTMYYSGALSSNLGSVNQGNEAYRFGSEFSYNAIRYAWIYIENVEKVPDMSESERNERIAEAKMIIAISYAEMLRYVGGVPLLDHAIDPNEPMDFPRATFTATVDYIVQLLDEAIPYLKWKQNDVDDGRMTKAGAMGMKLRILLFAASPMFNSSTLWNEAADECTSYTNEESGRWERAMKAGEEFMAELARQGQYGLIQPENDSHKAHRDAFQKAYYDRGGTEILISVRRGYAVSVHNPLFDQRPYSGVTLNYVNMFPWADGEDFPTDFDWKNPPKQPFYTEEGEPTRDPRLYETVALPGSKYFNDTSAPVHINHPNYRAGGSGFLMKKFMLESESERSGRPVQWPYLRLAEVLLSYAEAINEAKGAPTSIAYDCVNQVRNRVGLPNLPQTMDKISFREAVLRERALEFGFEEVRWFDLIRWKMADDFQKDLYGLTSKGLDDNNNPTKFSFSTYELKARYWKSNWNTKWFLAPIPQTEINKGYGMTQNPGW